MKRNNNIIKKSISKTSLLFALCSFIFVSCTQEDDFTPQGDADAVKINATIGALQTRVA